MIVNCKIFFVFYDPDFFEGMDNSSVFNKFGAWKIRTAETVEIFLDL